MTDDPRSGRLSAAEVTARVDARHWRVVLDRLHATFATGSFGAGVELVRRIGAAADAADHHPDVDLRYPAVHVALVSHDARGLTTRDVALAARISAIADELGVAGSPGAPQELEIAVDALDVPAVVPFWRAVLGYEDEPAPADDASPALVDPAGRGPAVWFQQMDAPRPQRNRIHVDVSVPHDVAEERVRAALAAGGRLVSDANAPAWWVLADPEGNEACVTTWQGRGD
jgi:4a-hydroxytetrahydrobiopterin dehydratase